MEKGVKRFLRGKELTIALSIPESDITNSSTKLGANSAQKSVFDVIMKNLEVDFEDIHDQEPQGRKDLDAEELIEVMMRRL
eukprot:snap_masked-scaffold_3-processed-gene-10.44-mRNA-1 protein AED:1.00 eAED:1.00 QI:0/-1/0/0/-1/1/1/0/80